MEHQDKSRLGNVESVTSVALLNGTKEADNVGSRGCAKSLRVLLIRSLSQSGLPAADWELSDIRYYLWQARSVQQPVNIALVGERAAGKTSLLNIIEYEARQLGLLAVRISGCRLCARGGHTGC